MKFERIYRMRIILADEEIVIEPPLTVEFSIERTAMATMNTASFSVYNLSKKNQRKIFKDRFRLGANRKQLIFEAGYDGRLTRIFTGDIFQAYPIREGVDMKTVIECRTGYSDITSVRVDRTFSAGITLHELYDQLIGDFSYLTKGGYGSENVIFNRPVSVEGNAYESLRTYSRDQIFVDEEKVYDVGFDEAIGGEVYVLSPETGLLQTPRREEVFITVETLFEPRPSMNRLVELRSETAPVYNGQYKVIGATHSGIISQAVGGTLTSRFNLMNSNTIGEFNVIEEE